MSVRRIVVTLAFVSASLFALQQGVFAFDDPDTCQGFGGNEGFYSTMTTCNTDKDSACTTWCHDHACEFDFAWCADSGLPVPLPVGRECECKPF